MTVPQPPPRLTLDALNHPILAWAEWESVRVTGDRSRLRWSTNRWCATTGRCRPIVQQGNGLYMTDWASMDNSPRNEYLAQGGTAVDTSSQMVLFANHLAQMAELLGKKEEAAAFRREAAEVAKTINEKMWNAERKFYFDLTVDGTQSPAKTIAAFWTLLAGVASPEQAEALAAELRNPDSFGRHHRVPTTPADQPGFDPAGGYWRGAVWSPTNTMVIRGLERYGQTRPGHASWRWSTCEAWARCSRRPAPSGRTMPRTRPTPASRPRRISWAGPALCRSCTSSNTPSACNRTRRNNRLTWVLTSPKRCGCERYRFNGHMVSLIAEPTAGDAAKTRVTVESDGAFQLRIVRGKKQLEATVPVGRSVFQID